MTAIRTGKVWYLAGDYDRGQWEACELSLFSDATLHLAYSETKTILEIGTLALAVPLESVRGGFVIKSNESEGSQYSSGPIFKINNEEDGRQWRMAISETILKKKLASKHEHPLPQDSVYKDGVKCLACKSDYPYSRGYYECEYCDYTICEYCYTSFYNLPRYPVVTSASHPHQLVRPELINYDSNNSSKPECSRCHTRCTGYHYVCSQCPGYFECSTCAYELIHNISETIHSTDSTATKEMRLDLGNLSHVISTPTPNTFVIDNASDKKCPSSMSIISQQHWDLSNIESAPVPLAYFEVTFKRVCGTVGVGVGNQMFTQNRMLGQQQNSYGYLSDGRLYVSNGYNGENGEFPSINEGDTIGAGILLDSYNLRRLYFTKNGKMLGCFPGRVHRGMDCFPGVSFTKQGAEFEVNMNGPFKFDPNTIHDYRQRRKKNLFKKLPREIIAEILLFASYGNNSYSATIGHDTMLQNRLISKRFKKASDENTVWQILFRWRFPSAYHSVKVKSWKQLYKARYLATANQSPSNISPIENCSFEFQCPILWEKLETTSNDTERHCNKCNKTVYEVTDQETLQKYAKMGRCVSLVVRRRRRRGGDDGDYDDDYYDERMGGEAPQQPRDIPYHGPVGLDIDEGITLLL